MASAAGKRGESNSFDFRFRSMNSAKATKPSRDANFENLKLDHRKKQGIILIWLGKQLLQTVKESDIDLLRLAQFANSLIDSEHLQVV